jgi:alkylated DNA repair dioxygenase AlkB
MPVTLYDGLEDHLLDATHWFSAGHLPDDLVLNEAQFEELWNLHPREYHTIKIHGRDVLTPRWQQAFGADYHYTGRVNRALPMLPLLAPLLAWAKATIDDELNGTLVNWYDGRLGHYIGAHRDSRKNMVVEAPIVTVSFGEGRVFRLRPWKGTGYRDFPANHGTVFVMAYDTNLAWTHEVPHAAKHRGRRISVTFRAFAKGTHSEDTER